MTGDEYRAALLRSNADAELTVEFFPTPNMVLAWIRRWVR
jgi:hypothetical protein